MEDFPGHEGLNPGSSGCHHSLLIGEPSLADVMAAITADQSLPPMRRQHWLTSIRRIGEGIGRPPKSLPARLTSLRHPVSRLNAARMKITRKSLANHKSNLKAAILYFMKGQGGAEFAARPWQRAGRP